MNRVILPGVTSAPLTLPASQPKASLSLNLSSPLSKNLTNNSITSALTPKPDVDKSDSKAVSPPRKPLWG